jgi:hypothetical protein
MLTAAPASASVTFDCGTISVRQLELTECSKYRHYDSNGTLSSHALPFLRQTSFPRTTALVLRYKPSHDPTFTGTLRVAEIVHGGLPDELIAQLQDVRVELAGWEYIKNLEMIEQLFDKVHQRGGLLVEAETVSWDSFEGRYVTGLTTSDRYMQAHYAAPQSNHTIVTQA